ncbi:MAG: tail fiber domain-containing protein [Betaproteobacteria bacterium]
MGILKGAGRAIWVATKVTAKVGAKAAGATAKVPEGFSHFVTSMPAPVASGWSGRRVGLAPTGKRRLITAHTHSRHRQKWVWFIAISFILSFVVQVSVGRALRPARNRVARWASACSCDQSESSFRRPHYSHTRRWMSCSHSNVAAETLSPPHAERSNGGKAMSRSSKRTVALLRSCVALLIILSCGIAKAQIPQKINYQGYLTTSGGAPISASLPMVFKLYTVPSGGIELYSETQTVTVANGIFNVLIGAVTPFPPTATFGVPYYLGVTAGADPAELAPRQLLAASPYSLRATTADALAPSATVAGSRLTGTISIATLPTSQLSGTIGTAQIANNAVTQGKLSPLSGGTAGKVLGTDGTNLQWQAPGLGTVTSIATGTGLTGGPITGTGTINLAATQLLPAVACAATQIPKWNGTAWACAPDDFGAITGNLTLPQFSTASAGNIMKGAFTFIHNFGSSNTFVGLAAGNLTMTGNSNTVIGVDAFGANTTGSQNTASGRNTLAFNTQGSFNTATGAGALLSNTTGSNNTASGANALLSNNTGHDNAAAGMNALTANTTGYYNTASGGGALGSNTVGFQNTAVGAAALFSNIDGNSNTATGFQALNDNTNGSANTATGYQALFNNMTGTQNTAAGIFALRNNTTGRQNTATGVNALASNNGDGNTATGNDALRSNTGGFANTASGAAALYSNTSGGANTASGAGALRANTIGEHNTATGEAALWSNVDGSNNTASGELALYYNTSGNFNTAAGQGSLLNNTTGNDNTATGAGALFGNQVGFENTAHGFRALNDNNDGNFNTAVGSGTLQRNNHGTANTALGAGALASNTSGSSNIALGNGAGFLLTTGDNNIYIGHEGGYFGESGTIRIGDSLFQSSIYLGGVPNVGTITPLCIFFDGSLTGCSPSVRRLKDDIADMGTSTSRLLKLRPVTFHYKASEKALPRGLQYGLIAEEVAVVYPELAARSNDGEIQGVMYQFLPPMLLNEYQKQQHTIEAQTTELVRQAQAIGEQTTRIAGLERDRQAQIARIDALERQATKLAALKEQVAQLARLRSPVASESSLADGLAGKLAVTARATP